MARGSMFNKPVSESGRVRANFSDQALVGSSPGHSKQHRQRAEKIPRRMSSSDSSLAARTLLSGWGRPTVDYPSLLTAAIASHHIQHEIRGDF